METVQPKVFLLGYTDVDKDALLDYLRYADVEGFNEVFLAALEGGVHPGEALCSLYAKLCYKALTTDHNDNISRVRDVEGNVRGCFDTGHGSVFEHCNLNFIVTDCSRVFTHELVRHRVGTAFSQTSGRYVRSDNLKMVLEDPIVGQVPIKEGEDADLLQQMKDWGQEIEDTYNKIVDTIDWDAMDFGLKKKITSYLRRNLPNGQANEIGFSTNIRTLRHLVQMRTSRFAEWEIRLAFGQIYELTKNKFPLLFHGAKETMVDGLVEITGMKMQPYEDLAMFSDDDLRKELERRNK
jgi:thymidylate synthase (FAD)